MESLDLNIENYQLEDILKLFNITENFDENDLKNAKKIVLKIHPDKSNLEPKYFLFFTKAYKMIYRLWEFKNKHKLKNSISIQNEMYSQSNLDREDRNHLLDQFLDQKQFKNPKIFNKWFNEQFEKNKIESEEQLNGYGSWLQSDENIDIPKNINPSQISEEINKKKAELRSMIVSKDIKELDLHYQGVTNLSGEVPELYCSDLFSNLPYEDLRKAHTETVIPITMEDYDESKKFSNIQQYKEFRSHQPLEPLSEKQAKEYLNNKYKLQDRETTERAFKLTKQLEESNKKQETFWSSIQYIRDIQEK